MNKERMLRVADAIEKHEIPWLGFNMAVIANPASPEDEGLDRSGRGCGTVACIAGWAFTLAQRVGEKTLRTLSGSTIDARATKWLDLTDGQSNQLFYPDGNVMMTCTVAQAVAQLRRAAETGDCRWPAEDGA